MPFEPGHKLAPGGKRPGAGRKPDQFKRLFEQAAKKVVTAAAMEEIVRSVVDNARQGDTKAQALLFDRLLGKAVQPVTGEDGGPIAISVREVVVRLPGTPNDEAEASDEADGA